VLSSAYDPFVPTYSKFLISISLRNVQAYGFSLTGSEVEFYANFGPIDGTSIVFSLV
jgi:hypothetical protein